MKFQNPKSLLFLFLLTFFSNRSSVVLGQNQWRGTPNINGVALWQDGVNWNQGDPTGGAGAARQVEFGSNLFPGASFAVELSEGAPGQSADTVTFLGTAGAFTLAGGDDLTITGNAGNTAANAVQNNSNSLQTIQNNVFLTGTNRTIGNANAGSLRFNGAVSSGANALTVSNSSSGAVVFSGSVTAGGTGITKSGTGTVVFNSTVTGGTGITVSAGRMEGIGNIGSATTIASGASYSAGQSGVGTQTFASALTFQDNLSGNANFVWDLQNNANPTPDSFDRVITNGGLNIGTGFRTQINLSGSAVQVNDSWNVFSGSTISGTSLTNLLAGTFAVTGAPVGISFQWNSNGTITAVPEPSSMALLGMAGLIGGVYARRRAKKNKA